MATKQFLSLEGLSTYDSLIKQYIGTEDAKSIKSITVVGNTVSFFKTADASGTASYTVNLPDVSGFMSKIAYATGGMLVESLATGEVSETNISTSDILTKIDEATGRNIVSSNSDGTISESGISIDDVATWDDGIIRSGYFVLSGTDHEISESAYSADDLNRMLTDISTLQSDMGTAQSDISTLQSDMDTAQSDISTLQDAVSTLTDNFDTLDGEFETLDQSLSTVAKSGESGDVTYDNTDSGLTATDVQSAIDELAEASSSGVASKTVYLRDESAGQSDYAKVYKLYQGANAPDAQTDPATLIGTVNIPLDKVVQDGHIVTVEDGVDSDGDTVPAGTADGTYVKLTFQNVSTPVYINVEDLVDVYTGGTTAEATVSISNTNEITVTINEINGSKLAATSVAKGKLATAVQDSLDLADSAVQSVAEGSANGTVAVDGTDVAVHGLGSAAYTASTAYEAAGAVDTAIAALDADLDASGTAQHSGTFVVSGVTEVDGVITAVDSTEVEAAGAAATAKSEVIGSSTDTASASTIYGAKAYADASTEGIATSDIEALFD